MNSCNNRAIDDDIKESTENCNLCYQFFPPSNFNSAYETSSNIKENVFYFCWSILFVPVNLPSTLGLGEKSKFKTKTCSLGF